MAERAEIFFHTSGLNSDDSWEAMPMGDSPVDYDDRAKSITTGLTHAEGVTPVLSGYAIDTENNKVYYFLRDTTGGYNSIVEFDPMGADDDTAFDKIIWDNTALELDDRFLRPEETPIVDGWIYYNGGTYGLKKVNIEYGRNFETYDAWSSGGSYDADDIVRVRDGRTYKNLTGSNSTDPRTDSTNWEEYTEYTYPCDSSGDLEAISLFRGNISVSK